jgi:4-hydroxybenzoate polyprenyltransferase
MFGCRERWHQLQYSLGHKDPCTAVMQQESPPVLSQPGQQEPESKDLLYHLHTLFLFTYDQFFDTIIPGAMFGLLTTLAGPALSLPAQSTLTVLRRAPAISAWLWLIILQFCLQNQCSEGAGEEDAENKPWRPIPSKRITVADARRLLMPTRMVASAASWYLGVSLPFLCWSVLGSLYNNYGFSDRSGLARNVFCGLFFTCSFGGALIIALNAEEISKPARYWIALVCCCILMTTIQTQEFRDEKGDRNRRRRTLVTELGRARALCTVYVAVTFWSLHVPPTPPLNKPNRSPLGTYRLDSLQVAGSLHYSQYSLVSFYLSQRSRLCGIMSRRSIAGCTSFGACGWLHSSHYL